MAALLLAACGDGGGSDGTGTTGSAVEQAQANVTRAQEAVDRAQSDFDDASGQFCADSADLIEVLDRYGQILDDSAVTVGEVKSGAADLTETRADAGSSAEAVLDARAKLDDAKADLATAEAELASAQAAEDTGTTDTTATTSTTATTEPLVPADVTARVDDAEQALVSAAESIDDNTPVAEASVQLQSATFAVQVAWMQLFAAAGCLDDEQRAEAIQTVTEYTTALQTDLQTAGFYSGPIDGIYGATTVDAVEQLQQAAGLPVTGLLDGPSEQALDAAVQDATGAALAGASTHTAAIQGALKVLGYWDGPIDGAWTQELSDAISKLQEDLGVEPTGAVDAATLSALEDALADVGSVDTTTSTTDAGSSTTTT